MQRRHENAEVHGHVDRVGADKEFRVFEALPSGTSYGPRNPYRGTLKDEKELPNGCPDQHQDYLEVAQKSKTLIRAK